MAAVGWAAGRRQNAYSVATPDDVREAFADLPEVLAVLREVGALS